MEYNFITVTISMQGIITVLQIRPINKRRVEDLFQKKNI